MTLSCEVDQIQEDLSSLKTRLNAFDTEFKVVLESDHDNMLAELRKSVTSVESSIAYLETGESPFTRYLEFITPSSTAAASRVMVKKHVADMDANFDTLREVAASALTRVEGTKKTCDDMHDELGTIRLNLESVTRRTELALSSAKETLGRKQRQASVATASLQATQQQLQALEEKMKTEKEARNVLRAVRAISWGTTAFFPPAGLVAVTMEAIAADWRDDRKELKKQIASASTQVASLTSEVSEAEAEACWLETTVDGTRTLSGRLEDISTGSQEMRTLMCERLEEYQALKSSTDEFGAWTSELKGQTATAQVVGASSKLSHIGTSTITNTSTCTMADPEYMARLARIRQENEQRKAENRQRKEEKHQQNELRRAQMTPEERAADIEDEKRRQAIRKRLKAVEGQDLVAMALAGEFLGPDQQAHLLGQTPYAPDQTAFLRSLSGYKEEMGDIHNFQYRVYNIRDLDLWWCSPELCKFALCDWRIPRYAKDYGDAGVEDMYQKQLGRERKNDRREQARALVRGTDLKRAQYWARKMLTEFEAASGRGEQPDALKAWAGMRISTPSWVQDIYESKEDYGFVIYKSREVENRPAVARERWFEVWDGTGDVDSNNFRSYRAACDKVYQGWLMSPHMSQSWVPACPEHGLPSEDSPSAFREHFKAVEAPALRGSKPRILNNTFLVLTDDCVFPELDTHALEYEFEQGPEPGKLLPKDLPSFFLWAYDPDWEPPSPPGGATKVEAAVEGCTCRSTFAGGYGGADEDGYQGRVKVNIHDLFCWFYYARSTGVGLKDLWRKAQGMPDQTWWCRAAYWDISNPEWLA
ncbi:hypothetical protein ACJZ2D_012323 [Fusarium nematophilum]